MKDLLKNQLARNFGILKSQTDGLSHDESLLQFGFGGNCLNWTLGHIAVHRSLMLYIMTGEKYYAGDERKWYGFGSQPITSSEDDHLPLEQLINDLEALQDKLIEAISDCDFSRLDKEGNPIGDAISGLVWHDTYHSGQTEIHRQLVVGRAEAI